MTTIFFQVTIAAGLLLAIGVLRGIQGLGWRLGKLALWLTQYRQYIGWACLGLGNFLLLFRPGYVFHDLVGGCAGLLLFKSRVLIVPNRVFAIVPLPSR